MAGNEMTGAAEWPLAGLEMVLGYTFGDRALLATAMTAPSFRASCGVRPVADNQRLEFLGDAVLGLLAAEHLFKAHQEMDEGGLTIRRSHLTSGKALAKLARRIGLGAYLRIGVSDEQSGGLAKDRLLAEAFEAVFGAVWCDGGMDAARPLFEAVLSLAEGLPADAWAENPKGHLQEMSQRLTWAELPAYELVSTSGPNHAPMYAMRVHAGDGHEAVGEGKSKHEAEVHAARRLLELLREQGIE